MGRLWPFVVGSVALGLDAYVIAGLLPAIAADLRTTTGLAGLGVAAFTGAYAIGGPLLAGRAGRRSARGLGIALAVFAAGNIVTALAPSLAVFATARIVAGAAAGVYSPLSSAVAAATVGPERRGRALALVLAGLATGTVFGVPAGLLVAQYAGWRAAIWLITGVGAVALAGIWLRGGRDLPGVEAPGLADRLRTLADRDTLLTITVTLLTGMASLGLYTYVTPLLADSSLAAHQSVAIWLWGVGGALGALGIGHLVDRTPSALRLTLAILVLLAATFTGIALGPPAMLLGAALLAWGCLGWASLAPQQHTLLVGGRGDGATAVAANASANYLGSALGALGGSALTTHGLTGRQMAWAAAGLTVAAAALQLVRAVTGKQ